MCQKEEMRIITLTDADRLDKIEYWENRFESELDTVGTFFSNDKVPPRFRSKPFTGKDGRQHMACTIKDVARWSLTGHRAKGSYLDVPPAKEGTGCKSGFCE